MPKFNRAVVLLSGGVDSATCLSLAVKECGNENTFCLIAYYGQKHDKEIRCAKEIADYYTVPFRELDLSSVIKVEGCSLLKGSNLKIPHKSYATQLDSNDGDEAAFGIVNTYVPFRNGLLLSAAAAFAVEVGADVVVYGAHADDAAGNAYPDCSAEFIDAMGSAIYAGTGGKVKLAAPFAFVNKAEVVRQGLQLGTPYHLTWSCYEGGEEPCGECGTCIDRAEAFKANGVEDPAIIQRKEQLQ